MNFQKSDGGSDGEWGLGKQSSGLWQDSFCYCREITCKRRERQKETRSRVGATKRKTYGEGGGGEEQGGENMVCSGNTVGNIRTAPRKKMPASLGKNLNCQHMHLCSQKYTFFFLFQDDSSFPHQNTSNWETKRISFLHHVAFPGPFLSIPHKCVITTL